MKIASSVSLFRRRPPLLLLAVFMAIPVLGQNPLSGVLTSGMGDIATLKQNAEAGSRHCVVCNLVQKLPFEDRAVVIE
jgi:hypothetical protein